MRVLVTRPVQDASPWLHALQQAGHDAVALPLLAIQAAPDLGSVHQAWAQLVSYRAVMFVSGNAVAHFFAAKPAAAPPWNSNSAAPQAWGTGPGTRRALLQAGLQAEQIQAPSADAAQFDSEALWQRVHTQVRAGDHVLIVRGTQGGATAGAEPGVGRDWLAAQLSQAGVAVHWAVAYQRGLPQWSAAQLAQARQAANGAALWLFSSSEAIGNLQTLLPGTAWGQARALATHPRIAQAARLAGFGVVQESRPTLPEVLASIESLA